MTARSKILILAASLALAPALLAAQDHAVPRGGGGGGGAPSGGGGHPSPGVSSSGSGSSSGYNDGSGSGSGSSSSSTAERRHPRAGTGSGGGYYPGYPGYPGYWPGYPGYYPGWGWGGGLYWGSWWPYGGYGWYGYGYPWGWGGDTAVYHYVENETGSVRVLVDPAEARVYVDGYYAGTVDDFDGLFQRLHVAPGRHEIALKLEGYKTHRVKIYVTPDATVKLHYNLEKGQGETFEDLSKGAPESEARRERPPQERGAEAEPRERSEEVGASAGTLHLSIRPADASVYVDGAFRGSGRETSSLKLFPGKHRVEVVRPGYRTVEREVEVAPGEPTEVTIELERPVS